MGVCDLNYCLGCADKFICLIKIHGEVSAPIFLSEIRSLELG